ncbi:MAG: hypothetical protein JW767_04710 [Thermoleophilia bacterium]|nr:hypothetical protein [Thermoleophilia bacterium]
MATRYLSIAPAGGEPYDIGEDAAGRSQWIFNVVATKRHSTTFVAELASILEAAGVGTRGTNILSGSVASIPDGDGPYLHVKSDPGAAPIGTHTEGRGAYRRPGARVVVTALSPTAAEAMARAAYEALIAVTNQDVDA